MLELGKGRITNMNMYQSLRKAETGLCSNILLWEPQECTPVEIKNSVCEAGRSQLTLVVGSSLTVSPFSSFLFEKNVQTEQRMSFVNYFLVLTNE